MRVAINKLDTDPKDKRACQVDAKLGRHTIDRANQSKIMTSKDIAAPVKTKSQLSLTILLGILASK